MVYLGDIGTIIKINLGEDVSGGSAFGIKYMAPDMSTGTWAAALDGTDAITATVPAGDIDAAGAWKVQAVVTVAAEKFHSTIGGFDAVTPLFLP